VLPVGAQGARVIVAHTLKAREHGLSGCQLGGDVLDLVFKSRVLVH
jgi:hypothetical protein